MDDGGNKSEFELEVNDKDTELVSADIESPGDEGDELPTDDKKVVEGDLPAPEKDPFEDELDSELDALEAEEKAEEETEGETEAEEAPEEEKPEEKPTEEEPTEEDKAAEAADAAEASEETTVAADAEAAEEKAEGEAEAEEPVEEEKPAEEEKPEEEPEEEPTEEEKPEEEKTEESTESEEAEEEPVAEVAEEKAEEVPEEEKPADEEPEEAPIVVDSVNAPVDSTQANSKFPVEPAEEKKKNSKTGIFVMIAIIVLLLIGIGIFFIMGGGLAKEEKKGNQGNQGGSDEPTPNKVIGISEFDVNLLKDLSTAKNNVYSPMSIKYAMSMLIEGTDGDTKKELEDAIGSYEPNKYTMSDHLSIANAIFVRDDFKAAIRKSYTDAIKEKYGANAIYDSFNSAATINDWVYTNTLKLIPQILTDDDLKEARFVIANTVAINMKWENVIQCSINNTSDCKDSKKYSVSYKHEKYSDYVRDYTDNYRSKVSFNGKEALGLEFAASINDYDIINVVGEDAIRSTVKDAYNKCVEESNGVGCEIGGTTIDKYLDDYVKEIGENYGKVDVSTDFQMYVDENVKMFAKDFKEYDGAQLQYVGIMPTSASLTDYIKEMTVDKLTTLVGGLKDIKKENFEGGKVTRIRGILPEFDFNEMYDLVGEFRALGANKVFTDDADLSKMLEDGVKEVEVGKIKHAAKIQFTNTGVKAAGATVIVGVGNAMDMDFEYDFDVPVEEIDMTFNKPFMYLIRDKATGEIWFMGTVYEGVAEKKN